MALNVKYRWTWDNFAAAMVLLDPMLFALTFWAEDLTIPESRLDLPAHWRGKQVISREQRIMLYDGAVYLLYRDAMPELAAESSQRVAQRTSRKIAKTLFMESLIIQVAITKTVPGVQEGMIHAPRENHMAPVRNRIEKKLETIPMFRLMKQGFDRENGILNFVNGWIWHLRIEGGSKSGTNMVGLRASVMFGDEADYSQEAAQVEREQTALPGCAQRWGGVPRGVRGIFWRICNVASDRSGWSVQRFDMRANPLYHSEKAWGEQVGDDYYSQRVQTQVLGRDGEEAISSFPVIPINATLPYQQRIFGGTEVKMNADNIKAFLCLPVDGIEADGWMIHMDYGYAPSPTELGISYLRYGTWHVLARFEIMRLDNVPMAQLIHEINTTALPTPASLIIVDAHGQGRGVLSALHNDPRWTDMKYEQKAVAVGFEGTTPLDGVYAHRKCKQIVRQDHDGYYVCDTCQSRIFDEKELTQATLSTKVHLTNELKEALARGQRVLDSAYGSWPDGVAVVLGADQHLIDELAGTTEIKTQGGVTRYITPGDADHMTDMLRCLVSGAKRFEAAQAGDYDTYDPDDMGWINSSLSTAGGNLAWTAPWQAT